MNKRLTPKALSDSLRMEIWQGSLENAQALLKAGADPNRRDSEGRYPLHFAAGIGRADICQLLLEAGAKTDAPDPVGLTPLTYAALGRISMLKEPREHLGEPEIPEPSAAAACIVLLHWGADPQAASAEGITPLHRAAWEYPSVCRILIQHGASISAADKEGDSPLAYAAVSPRPNAAECCGILIEAGADPEAKNHSGRTALHEAASKGREFSVVALLDAGCDIQARDNDENTPLHLAARILTTNACRALVDRGADPLARNSAGRLPIEDYGRLDRIIWTQFPETRREMEDILRSAMVRVEMERKTPKARSRKASKPLSKKGRIL